MDQESLFYNLGHTQVVYRVNEVIGPEKTNKTSKNHPDFRDEYVHRTLKIDQLVRYLSQK